MGEAEGYDGQGAEGVDMGHNSNTGYGASVSTVNMNRSYLIVYNAPCGSTDGRIVYVSETCMVAKGDEGI